MTELLTELLTENKPASKTSSKPSSLRHFLRNRPFGALPISRTLNGFYAFAEDDGNNGGDSGDAGDGNQDSANADDAAAESAAGRDGRDGANGANGANGKSGTSGANGKDAQVVINVNKGGGKDKGKEKSAANAAPSKSADKAADKTADKVDDKEDPDKPEYSKGYVESLRKEAQSAKEALKAASTELSGYKQKDLSELESAKAEATETKARLQEAETRLVAQTKDKAITNAVNRANPLYADVIATLLEKMDIPADDNGEPDPARLKRAIEDLKKERPALFKASSQGNDAGAGRSGGSAGAGGETDMNAVIRRAAGRR